MAKTLEMSGSTVDFVEQFFKCRFPRVFSDSSSECCFRLELKRRMEQMKKTQQPKNQPNSQIQSCSIRIMDYPYLNGWSLRLCKA